MGNVIAGIFILALAFLLFALGAVLLGLAADLMEIDVKKLLRRKKGGETK